MNNEKVVMYDSPEAASLQTVTGWVSRDGRSEGQNVFGRIQSRHRRDSRSTAQIG
jgi:hypothetical protein